MTTTWMDTQWTAPGEGCTLIELVMAADHCEIQGETTDYLMPHKARVEELHDRRTELEASGADLRTRRCELAIGDVWGYADETDVGRVSETLRRMLLRVKRGDV